MRPGSLLRIYASLPSSLSTNMAVCCYQEASSKGGAPFVIDSLVADSPAGISLCLCACYVMSGIGVA